MEFLVWYGDRYVCDLDILNKDEFDKIVGMCFFILFVLLILIFCIVEECYKLKILVVVNEIFFVFFFLYRWIDIVLKVFYGLFRIDFFCYL